MTLLIGADAIDVRVLPAKLDWVAGYVGGFWPTFSPEVERYPQLNKQGRVVSIAVNAAENARILDCENGDATPVECGPWLKRMLAGGVRKPGIYASLSEMPAVIASINASGIDRASIVLWVADWDGIADVPAGYEAKQWSDHGPNGENYDRDVALPTFFSTPQVHTNSVHYNWLQTVTAFGKKWDEKAIAQSYDRYRRQMTPNRKPAVARYKLFVLRQQCRFLAKRIDNVAHQPGKGGYKVEHRGYRRAQLWLRAQGGRATH